MRSEQGVSIVRKLLLSGLFAIAVIGALAPLGMRTASSQPTAPLLADVDEATLNELALSYRILVNHGAITGMQTALNASAGLIYPTDLRANGVGYALGVGRVGSIAGPLLGSLLTELEMPPATFFYVTAIGPLLCAGSWMLLLNLLRRTMGETDATATPTSASRA